MAKFLKIENLLGLILLVLGIFVIILAGPAMVSSYALIPGNAPLREVGYGKGVDQEGLDAITRSRTRALVWAPDPRVTSDLALAKVLESEQLGSGGTDQKKALLYEAEALLRQSLALKPADPYAWARLGYVQFLLEGPTKEVARALKLSFLTGPHEPPQLVFLRLKLALATLDYFALEDISLIRHQIRFAWKRQKQQTAYLAAAFQMEAFFLNAIETTDPGGRETFLNFIKRVKLPKG
ncbi:MAG: hypothetical protein V3R64_09905 [Sphingomonadales bacterium]